eukprot:5258667-Amphidinium_carterae.1
MAMNARKYESRRHQIRNYAPVNEWACSAALAFNRPACFTLDEKGLQNKTIARRLSRGFTTGKTKPIPRRICFYLSEWFVCNDENISPALHEEDKDASSHKCATVRSFENKIINNTISEGFPGTKFSQMSHNFLISLLVFFKTVNSLALPVSQPVLVREHAVDALNTCFFDAITPSAALVSRTGKISLFVTAALLVLTLCGPHPDSPLVGDVPTLRLHRARTRPTLQPSAKNRRSDSALLIRVLLPFLELPANNNRTCRRT